MASLQEKLDECEARNRALQGIVTKGGVGGVSIGDITVGDVSEANDHADEPLPEGTRVAYHDILRKRLVIGTRVGPITFELDSTLADQELEIDEKLAVFQKHNMLAPLYDRDKRGDQEG
ncbi:MAG: hypothetical protein F4X97_01080 [Boseongicola sp. SB0662_bin_57]|nr:hypothetical protein [Boseongicola sp. SB0662_bin_57]